LREGGRHLGTAPGGSRGSAGMGPVGGGGRPGDPPRRFVPQLPTSARSFRTPAGPFPPPPPGPACAAVFRTPHLRRRPAEPHRTRQPPGVARTAPAVSPEAPAPAVPPAAAPAL